LVHERFDGPHLKRSSIPMGIHVLLQVLVAELRGGKRKTQRQGEVRKGTCRVSCGPVGKGEESKRGKRLAYLEDENKLGLGVDDVPQANNVRVLELWSKGKRGNGEEGVGDVQP
jgi:hypothetical protein